jgi:uracil-DNA glycosylase
MQAVRLPSETDFDAWRAAARRLRLLGVPPEQVFWSADASLFSSPMPQSMGEVAGPVEGLTEGASHADQVSESSPLFSPPPLAGEDGPRSGPREGESLTHAPPQPASPAAPPQAGEQTLTVPRAFVDLARQVILHRWPERFALLYRLLWRLQSQPRLMRNTTDADVALANDMAKAVSKSAHKMKAFVRFRLVEGAEPETYVAWFEPAHRVTEQTAPFFVRRFANMAFSILTPDLCAHWDLERLTFTPGADRSRAPPEDELEEMWRTYYASIFNPARLKVEAMTKEMPKRYWRNLPEAQLIPSLIEDATRRTQAMVEAPAEAPRRKTAAGAAARVLREAAPAPLVQPGETPVPASLGEIAVLIQGCRRCDLWRCATQGVPGEGPAAAKLMLVGEQPGDQEDLAGKPFVGPAGQVLDRALAEAGVPRGEAYVTNAVKHFKHEARGKRRLHKTPDTGEVTACRWWLDNERRLVRPRVIVALGSTAVLSVFGRTMPIGKSRGRPFQLEDQSQAFVTYHPSFLLRLPDRAAKEKAYAEFVQDLGQAWGYLKAAT